MKIKLNFFLVLAVLVMGMSACGSDDNDNQTVNLAQNIAGSYTGYSVGEFKYSTTPMTTADEKMTLSAKDDGSLDISLVSSQWGTFTITGAAVSLNGNYTISGKGKTVMGMDATSQKEYDCSVSGTISTDKKTVTLIFDVPTVMGGLKVTFNLGDAPLNMLIAGTYSGILDLSVNGSSLGTSDNKVTIKSQDNGKSQVTLQGFGVTGMTLEDVVIPDVEVASKDRSYVLVGAIDSTNGTIKLTGSLNGTIKDGKANLVFVLKPGSMPMPITATFVSK